ncbi:uncharacterized protein LOC110096453 isoform X1 [Dendrobium catenatum]|uniref:SAP domain-containing protein n=2 Tax=Dendrobium TaxID=37818 RepID=A0A2I0WJ15_9ASPA|nr:uncharacterized protein LOC110096453 isoform X1 [Dendrobium catenatum]PKU75653.1 hypothetical protein MA16_Dca021430 [Dendrobium catenatum]
MEAENSDSSAPAREPEQASLGDDEMAAGGASKFLTNLPSRGLFSSAVLSSNLGSMRVYVCDHDTSPPEEQLIKTNATNILIRSLQINKLRIDSKDAKASVAITKGKRSAARPLDGKSSAKRTNTGATSSSGRQEGSSTGFSERMLQTMTVERLRAILKDKGLSPKGKKDELISRLKDES